MGAGSGADRPVPDAAKCMDQRGAAPLLGDYPQHSLCHSRRADCRAVLPKRRRKPGQALSASVAHGGAELCLLYPGGAVCGCGSRGGDADDPENLRLCLDGADWISCYEKGEYTMKKYLNVALVYAIAAMAGGVFYRAWLCSCTGRRPVLDYVFDVSNGKERSMIKLHTTAFHICLYFFLYSFGET